MQINRVDAHPAANKAAVFAIFVVLYSYTPIKIWLAPDPGSITNSLSVIAAEPVRKALTWIYLPVTGPGRPSLRVMFVRELIRNDAVSLIVHCHDLSSVAVVLAHRRSPDQQKWERHCHGGYGAPRHWHSSRNPFSQTGLPNHGLPSHNMKSCDCDCCDRIGSDVSQSQDSIAIRLRRRQRSRSFRQAIPLRNPYFIRLVMRLIYAAKKPNLFSVLILLRNSWIVLKKSLSRPPRITLYKAKIRLRFIIINVRRKCVLIFCRLRRARIFSTLSKEFCNGREPNLRRCGQSVAVTTPLIRLPA